MRHHLLQLRDSTVAVRRVQSVTVPSSRVTRECRSPGLRTPPLKHARIFQLHTFIERGLHGTEPDPKKVPKSYSKIGAAELVSCLVNRCIWRYLCELPFELPQTSINTFISATDPPLFLGVDACRDPGEGQF